MEGFNNYLEQFSPYYSAKLAHQEDIYKSVREHKRNAKEQFNNANELGAVWENKCETCYHRYSCSARGLGACKFPQSYLNSKEHDDYVVMEYIHNQTRKELL